MNSLKQKFESMKLCGDLENNYFSSTILQFCGGEPRDQIFGELKRAIIDVTSANFPYTFHVNGCKFIVDYCYYQNYYQQVHEAHLFCGPTNRDILFQGRDWVDEIILHVATLVNISPPHLPIQYVEDPFGGAIKCPRCTNQGNIAYQNLCHACRDYYIILDK